MSPETDEVGRLRRRAADAEARLATIADAMVDALVIIDDRGLIESCNRAAERMFGHTQDEMRGRNVNILMPEPYHAAHDGYMHRYMTTGEARIIGIGREARALRRDGSTFPIDLAVGEIRLPGGERRFLGVIRDIARRKAAEEEARHHRERLAQVGRVSTLGEMASGIAHEINQPLTAIAAYARACQRLHARGATDSPDFAEALDQIARQAERAGQIVHRLRSFVRQRAAAFDPVDLNAEVAAVLALADLDARNHDTRLVLDLAPEVPAVAADAIQIQQVILNLVRNAIDATAHLESGRRVVTIATSALADGLVEVRVSDPGPGVAPAAIEQIFNPFFTTKSAGMGLGLSISHTIIESHGGRLWHEPNDPQGAVFAFRLPVALSE